jgi:hypothetical protein
MHAWIGVGVVYITGLVLINVKVEHVDSEGHSNICE